MKPGAAFSHPATVLLVAATSVSLAIVAAPLLALAQASRPLAEVLYSLFALQCHQAAGRTLHLAGEPLAVCARCTAIYFGLAGGSFAALRSARLRSLAWLLPVAALLLLLDVSRDGTLATRILTGGLFGLGGAVAVAAWRGRDPTSLAVWGGRLATILLLAAPLVACAPRQKKAAKPKIALPVTPEAQACKEACNQGRDDCFAEVDTCKRLCTPDKPHTPYENEHAACARECEVKCQGGWKSCILKCPGAHYSDQPRPRVAPAQQAPPTVIIQQAPGGCRADVDCKGDRICSAGRCVSPSPPIIVAPGGCASDADCKGDRICVAGRCESPQPAVAPAPAPEPPRHAINREACEACAGTCAELTAKCNQGSIPDCYRAGACMCRCRLTAGGCGVDEAQLQRCITTNEEKAK